VTRISGRGHWHCSTHWHRQATARHGPSPSPGPGVTSGRSTPGPPEPGVAGVLVGGRRPHKPAVDGSPLAGSFSSNERSYGGSNAIRVSVELRKLEPHKLEV
jgi:hypothetical protein